MHARIATLSFRASLTSQFQFFFEIFAVILKKISFPYVLVSNCLKPKDASDLSVFCLFERKNISFSFHKDFQYKYPDTQKAQTY